VTKKVRELDRAGQQRAQTNAVTGIEDSNFGYGSPTSFQAHAARFRFSPGSASYRCVAPLGDQIG
jgi:hypothetical protein